MMCALVCGACIGLYLILYRSVFDFIRLVLVNILASVLALIEKTARIWSLFARIIISYNTITKHTNTDRYVLNTDLLVLNICRYVFNAYHQ